MTCLPKEMVVPHLILAGAWIAWCALHSFLITPRWVRFVRRHLGERFAYYRLAYVTVSIVTLLPVLWYQFTITTVTYWSWHWPWTLLQWAGLLLSGIILFLGARQYDQLFFFGIRQVREGMTEHDAEFSELETSGVLNHMRHPYYTAGIVLLIFWGNITAADIILKIVGIAYLIVGAFIEERKLIQEFGDQYRRYRRRVPMFIPRLSSGEGTDE